MYQATCIKCSRSQIFDTIHRGESRELTRVYPRVLDTEEPNSDLSNEAQIVFQEARKVFDDSPRAAAALLRLVLQMLMKQIGMPGENINSDIKGLVAQGLPQMFQQAADTIRIVGNQAVHPGEINIDDNRDLVLKLFKFINMLVQNRITEPRLASEAFGTLPEGSTAAVARRDAN